MFVNWEIFQQIQKPKIVNVFWSLVPKKQAISEGNNQVIKTYIGEVKALQKLHANTNYRLALVIKPRSRNQFNSGHEVFVFDGPHVLKYKL
jgi:hypothetical protein